jgi:hypothetical protein
MRITHTITIKVPMELVVAPSMLEGLALPLLATFQI